MKFFLYSPILIKRLECYLSQLLYTESWMARTITSSFLSFYRWKKNALVSIVVCLIIFSHSIFFLISIVFSFFFFQFVSCVRILSRLSSPSVEIDVTVLPYAPTARLRARYFKKIKVEIQMSSSFLCRPDVSFIRTKEFFDSDLHSMGRLTLDAISCAHINCMTSCRINTKTESLQSQNNRKDVPWWNNAMVNHASILKTWF